MLGISGCGTWPLWPRGVWSLLPEVRLVSPALTGGFLTNGLPGKSYFLVFLDSDHSVGCEVMPHCGFDLHFPHDR